MKYYGGIIKIVALVVLLPIVLGKCTFSKTYRLYRDYRHIQTMEDQLVHTASDNVLKINPTTTQNENLVSNGRLVELISQACDANNVSVKQYEPLLLDSEGGYRLYGASLVLSGNYVDLVKILQYREGNLQSVKVSSLKFEYDEKRMKEKKVVMTVSITHIES